MQRNTLNERNDPQENSDDISAPGMTNRDHDKVFIEHPLSNSPGSHPVNGNYAPDDEDEDEDEDDLILGDEDELEGDEEEYDVEFEDDFDESDIDEDDLVIDSGEDIDEEDDDEDDDL